jgi:CRISPR-associated protein Cmr2
MSRLFWQAKIWGLLHDPALKPLRHTRNFSDEGPWCQLACMGGWVSPKAVTAIKEAQLNGEWLKHVGRCDLIASASDRSTIGRMPPEYSTVSYGEQGLEITHLLSGKSSKPHLVVH